MLSKCSDHDYNSQPDKDQPLSGGTERWCSNDETVLVPYQSCVLYVIYKTRIGFIDLPIAGNSN
jgi:hypothetical protein